MAFDQVLSRFTVKVRVFLGFGLVLALLALVAATGIGGLGSANDGAAASATAARELFARIRKDIAGKIVRNVQEAANGNHEVTSNISEVSSAAHLTGEMASNMYKVAEVLEESGTSLGKHVETFLSSVKAV